jgi:hypothetical protein
MKTIQELLDAGVTEIDIMHGMLKNMMIETENDYLPLMEQSNKIGSDEEYDNTVRRLYLEGYLDALTNVYGLTYDISLGGK